MTNVQIKHLEFIQNSITRMNKNSFQIKTFTITLVAALLAVYASSKNVYFLIITLFPTVLFWFLDAYYLQQERKFRGVYNHITGLKKILALQIQDFEMPIHKFVDGEFGYRQVLFSKTIVWFYGSILGLIGIVSFLLLSFTCI